MLFIWIVYLSRCDESPVFFVLLIVFINFVILKQYTKGQWTPYIWPSNCLLNSYKQGIIHTIHEWNYQIIIYILYKKEGTQAYLLIRSY